jgi:hypothetical protein
METGTETQERTGNRRQGRLTYYHANGKGTGAVMQIDMRLNEGDERRYDCFFLTMARQKSVAAKVDGRDVPASFDWDGRVAVKLGFGDVCELLAVLEGRRDTAGQSGKGLYHASGDGSTIVEFSRQSDREAYGLAVSRKGSDGAQVFRGQMILSDAEAIGLRCVFQQGLFFLSFHASIAAA